MTTRTLTAAVTAFGLLSEPDASHSGQSYLTIQKDQAVPFVYHPITCVPPGATLVGALLRVYAKDSWGLTPVLTAQAADSAWSSSSLSWNAMPAGTGAISTVSHASAADGDLFELDVLTQATAMLNAGNGFGFIVERTDGGASKAIYSQLDPTYAPQLQLSWTFETPGPTLQKPSGGRAVATDEPTMTLLDATDVQWIQIQVDNTAGAFTSPLFDSGWVAVETGALDLSTTAYTGGGGASVGLDKTWRGRYKNSGGVESPWSPVAHWTYRPYAATAITNPAPDPNDIVLTDTPTLAWSVTGTQTKAALTLAKSATPMVAVHTKTLPGATAAYAVPTGVIIDSSPWTMTLEISDNYAREAIPGYPATLVLTQEFTFQDSGAVAPPDTMWVEQVGSTSFLKYFWTRHDDPDDWAIRCDEEVVFSGPIDDPRFSQDADGVWSFIHYGAAGNRLHHLRVAAKEGGQSSAGGPTADALTEPVGINIADPFAQKSVFMRGRDPGDWAQPETSAVYIPLRGNDSVRITQTQRGYEGTLRGFLRTADGVTAAEGYNTLQAMRNVPSRPMVIALPNIAIMATISGISPAPADDVQERWDVELTFEQQGTTLWLHGQDATLPSSELIALYDFEEGTDGAAVTTSSPGVTAVDGDVRYRASAAMHGVMGIQIPNAVGGGRAYWDCPYVGMLDVYMTPRVSTDVGNAMRWISDHGDTVFGLLLRSSGKIGITDSTGALQESSTGSEAWIIDHRGRVQVQWTWWIGMITVWVRLFSSPESSIPSDQFFATFAADEAPVALDLGNATSTKKTDYDSLRIYKGTATWADPLQPGGDAEPVYSIAGLPSRTGATIASQVLNVDTIDLAYSTTLTGTDPASPTYVGAQTPDDEGFVKHSLSGLTAGTQYYAKLSTGPGQFVGDLVKVKTLPAAGGAATVKIAVGSCQRNARSVTNQAAWADQQSWGPDMVVHLGDVHYQGGHFTDPTDWTEHTGRVVDQIVGLPTMKQVWQAAALLVMEDDHDFSGNNGDSLAGTPTGIARAAGILAYQKMFAMYPLADTAAPEDKRGLYGSFMLTDHVRVIMLDAETLDRSAALDPDSSSKTFAGGPQDTWLRTVLVQPAAVNLIFCGKSFVGADVDTGTRTGNDLDKPWNYPTWRANLITWIGAHTQTGGAPIKVAWVGADRHANGYLNKTTGNTTIPGHPCIVASGYDQDSLATTGGEVYTAAYGFKPTTAVRQYVQMTVGDDNAGTVTVEWKSREVHDLGTNAVVDGFDYSTTWTY